MTDELTCAECGESAESIEDLEPAGDVVTVDDDGSFDLFAKHDLFLCSGCRNPMGVRRV